MLPDNFYRTVLKFVAWILFWTSPAIIVLLLSHTLTGHAASLPLPKPQGTITPSEILEPKAKEATPDKITATPQPVSARDISNQIIDQDTSTFWTFLPLIFNIPSPTPLISNVPVIFGPIEDPPIPSLGPGNLESTPIIDPPTPTLPAQTPTPGGPPTEIPTTTPTPTPKPTLTPTKMPTATPEPVPNGDLENEGNGWTEYSLLEYDLFFDNDSGSVPNVPGGAYSGDWVAWLGGANSEISYIQRQFTLPNPAAGEYKRYYLAHRIRIQSYDSVCASDKYSSMPDVARNVMLAGHLLYASADTLDTFGVDLGGMIVCVNQPNKSGCGRDKVMPVVGNPKQIYVSAYDLCGVPDGTSWDVFLFPITFLDHDGNLIGGPELSGSTITVQIKTITDSQLSSSVVVDDVRLWAGPPLPTPTPGAAAAGSDNVNVHIMEPILVSEPPNLSGVQYLQTGEKPLNLQSLSSPDAFLKKR